VSSAVVPPNGRQSRVRRPAAPPPFSWRRLPLFVWVLAGCGLLWAAWAAFDALRPRWVELRFVHGGGPVPELTLTFFPDQLAFTAPSPAAPIGQLRLQGSDTAVVGRDLVPDRAVVRYEGQGVGTGFLFVELDRPLPPIELRAPQTVRGRIGEPKGLWAYGWRCAGFVPVADAEVLAMGGGEHGVVLAKARTGNDGRFELAGVDGGLGTIGLRVLASGFALAQLDVPLQSVDNAAPVVPMVRAPALQGRVHAPDGVDPSTLRVLARGLPGIVAAPAADGAFVLEHLPPDASPRLLLHGLGDGFAQAPARVVRGQPLRIDVVPAAVVRGRVVERATHVSMGDVLVFCGDDISVRADARGRFELTRVLPGNVEVVAQWESKNRRKRQIVRTGRQQLAIAPGQVVEDLVIEID
jgi:hypothetical protein